MQLGARGLYPTWPHRSENEGCGPIEALPAKRVSLVRPRSPAQSPTPAHAALRSSRVLSRNPEDLTHSPDPTVTREYLATLTRNELRSGQPRHCTMPNFCPADQTPPMVTNGEKGVKKRPKHLNWVSARNRRLTAETRRGDPRHFRPPSGEGWSSMERRRLSCMARSTSACL